jgi:hypothetical protein
MSIYTHPCAAVVPKHHLNPIWLTHLPALTEHGYARVKQIELRQFYQAYSGQIVQFEPTAPAKNKILESVNSIRGRK